MLGKALAHILLGVVFSGIGLWQLINHIRLFFSLGPDSYVAPVWFPAPRVRYLELIVMIAGSVIGIAAPPIVFRSWKPSSNNAEAGSLILPFFVKEHNVILAMGVVYATCAMCLDHARVRGRRTLCMLVLAALFAQELFMVHVHSANHAGVQWQLHRLLQLIITVCLAAALLGACLPQSFAVSLVRSASMMFQGVWILVIGVKWIPSMVATGCSIDLDVGENDVKYRCHSDASEHHAKAVVNLQFAWCMTLITVFVVGLYSYSSKSYPAHVEETYTYGRLPPPEAGDCKAARIGDDDAHDLMPMQIQV